MRSSLLLLGVAAISAGVIGYLLGNIVPLQEKVATADLTVQEEFLTNPIFYEWWASAEGTVIQKGKNSITIEKDGRRVQLLVSVEDGRTQVFRETQEANTATPANASYDDIVEGSYIRTGAAVARKGTLGIAGEENVALATTLVIISEQ